MSRIIARVLQENVVFVAPRVVAIVVFLGQEPGVIVARLFARGELGCVDQGAAFQSLAVFVQGAASVRVEVLEIVAVSRLRWKVSLEFNRVNKRLRADMRNMKSASEVAPF